MKHPAYRINDFLRMHPEWRKKAFDYALGVLDMIPKSMGVFGRDGKIHAVTFEPGDLKLQAVGSFGRGVATLGSDMDFNVAVIPLPDGTPDWNRQMVLKRWFHTAPNPGMGKIIDYLDVFKKQWGLELNVSSTDPTSWSYNTHVDIETMTLHHRGKFLDNFIANVATVVDETIDQHPIDLNNPGDIPPAQKENLVYDGMVGSWKARNVFLPNKRMSAYSTDEWIDEVPKWQAYYGDYFCSYHVVPEGDGLKYEPHYDKPVQRMGDGENPMIVLLRKAADACRTTDQDTARQLDDFTLKLSIGGRSTDPDATYHEGICAVCGVEMPKQ